ncbi:winged helix-turn-helix domain-containing protein [Chitinimonas arctica]|uniref:Winged helix-turn-helix domain-containing protein n=1 Tax=Chitinimonas arctica TaxID=2594795 RepID=A0A516SG65_9NEIS|nr:winged helix-turn-helix domain-containing protein [Chitinimonas arctica]QDQ27159.1 winged helix-turn-helix domain-containing protein [Chitinimonas arctica]
MTNPALSLAAARSLHLAAQGLLAPSRRKAGKADVLACIRRMALLQIDTIHVVARSPYLVLWSRLGQYDPAWLEALLAEGKLFEYWAHEACFVPTEDYGLLRHRMLDLTGMGWKFSLQWLQKHGAEIEALVQRIREQGPVRSADFERAGGGKGSGWWDWKPEKRHLEVLFTSGRLMVAERRNFQRVYDLAERVLARGFADGWRDERDLPTPEAARLEMIRRSCQALGVVKAGWIADYYRLKGGKYEQPLHALADSGELIPVRLESASHDAFVHRDLAPLLDKAVAGELQSTVTTLLSPFDPVVWDRKRAAELFDFDYRIECYTPAEKRKYGYFVLPILSRGKLVGRVDAKAHRKLGVFELKALYLEPGIRASQRLIGDIGAAVQRCADWHGTPHIEVRNAPFVLPTRDAP